MTTTKNPPPYKHGGKWGDRMLEVKAKRHPPMFVKCRECGEEHNSEEVRATDINEDFEGRDVLTFVCPVTSKETKSLVYRNG